MSIAIGDPVSGGTAHSILFVGPGTVLAQDNTNFKWNTTDKTLLVNGAGAKFGSFTAMNTGSNATSSTNNAIKTALSVTSIGTWNGTNAENRALYARASGGPADANYAGFFDEGDVVLKQGRLGVQVLKPTARLHVTAGSASPGAAAMKFNSGALLSIPEAGAFEWDGSEFYRTNATARRPLETSLHIANVLDFGAKGDGFTDDAAAFQAAVDSLLSTGGIVWVPSDRTYQIGSKVVIRCRFPIWIVSGMGNRLLSGTAGQTHTGSALIRPNDDITYLFEWARPVTPFNHFFSCGGGGVEGLAFGDWDAGSSPPDRNHSIDGAINIDEAAYFTIRDSYFAWLKGRAVRCGRCVIFRVEDTWITRCGDSSKSAMDLDGSSLNTAIDKPITNIVSSGVPTPNLIRVTVPSHGFSTGDEIYIAYVKGTVEANGKWTITVINANEFDLQGSAFTNTYVANTGKAGKDLAFAALWAHNMGMEVCSYGAGYIKPTTQGHIWLRDGYFEDFVPEPPDPYVSDVYVDTSAGGGATIQDCTFGSSNNTAIILGGTGSIIRNSTITHFPGTDSSVIVNAFQCKLDNLRISAAGQTGVCLDIQGALNQLSNIYLIGGGRLRVSTISNSLSNIVSIASTSPAGTYAIDLGVFGNTLTGCVVDGYNGSSNAVCGGIYAAGSTVIGAIVTRVNGVGIDCSGTVEGCQVYGIGGMNPTPYVYYNGTRARNNYLGGTATGTTSGTGATSTITQNGEAGSFVTDTITTTPGATHTITLTNSVLSTASTIYAKATLHDSSAGQPILEKETRNNGSVVWVIRNIGAAAFNGTNPLRVDYIVQNF